MRQLSLPLTVPNPAIEKASWFPEILAALGISCDPGWPDCFAKAMRGQQNHYPIKTLSLFSGGGGLDIAFHDCGFDIVAMVEVEAKYVRTLQQNTEPGKWLEGSKPICIDIREYLPPSDLKVDFIIGGPPCQTFSAAGRRAAGVAGTNDARGNLFQEYVRLLKLLQPKGFLFENVYGITGAQKGADFQAIQNAFKDAGYRIYYRVLDAADYGVPQHRERLFIVGLKERNYLFPYPTHGPDSPGGDAALANPYYSAGKAVAGVNILEESEAEVGIGGKYGHLLADIPPGLNYSFYTEKMGHPQPVFSWRSKFSDFLYKADPDRPARTIKAKGGQYTGPFSWENRRFTVAELKRLQTIPDDYELVGNDATQIEQIGNSVPPQLGRILALSILEQAFGVSLPFSMQYLPVEKQLGFRQRKRKLTAVYARKAREAIALQLATGKLAATPTPNSRFQGVAVRFLSADFAWSKTKLANSIKIYLKYDLGCDREASLQENRVGGALRSGDSGAQRIADPQENRWEIAAAQEENGTNQHDYTIEIIPASPQENWGLDAKRVLLHAGELDGREFTALWKAFEEKVIERSLLADLVQLSGYYQYKPRIKARLSFAPRLKIRTSLQVNSITNRAEEPREEFWRVVQCVVGGIGVGQQLEAQQMALLWGVGVERVFSYLQSLRRMGYEVRNQNTNIQIRPREYLIPYAFPTLTPKSVQLHKELGAMQ
ncbi:MAG: DNA cytosine methyltransferase [Oscillatoria sp. SIO1A7]|nr:DNA cytosine methyltransferase [Oscillatoria sp. SIO1A7]